MSLLLYVLAVFLIVTNPLVHPDSTASLQYERCTYYTADAD